ncbi:MAG: DNA-binding protein WhiA [Bacilli bacterium]|nr:DNA-binding protein WhiA [Bacilli bacterium]
MSFASEVKDELALKESEYPKDELSALFKTSGNITISNGRMSINFKSENAKIAQKVFRKIHSIYDIKPVTSIYRNMKFKKNNVYCLSIQEKVNTILEDLDLIELHNMKNIIRSDKRIKSFLSGCFMGSGSVNDPNKTNYHLELAFVDEVFAKEVLRLLEKINLSPKIIKRRNQYVVYMKKAQEIGDFLAGVGAINNYLAFEDIRMTRDFYNSDNRVNNCDIANAVRTNMAALQQIEDIKILEKYLGIKNLESDLYIIASLRLENPEDSLRELAEKFNEKTEKNISKSGVNHLFIKIKNKALEYAKK